MVIYVALKRAGTPKGLDGGRAVVRGPLTPLQGRESPGDPWRTPRMIPTAATAPVNRGKLTAGGELGLSLRGVCYQLRLPIAAGIRFLLVGFWELGLYASVYPGGRKRLRTPG